MTWTYSGDPSSREIDSYRFKIGDTVSDEPLLQDEEIQYILTTYTSENMRLFKLNEAVYLCFIRDVKTVLGPQQMDPTIRQQLAKERMDEYKKKLAMSGTPTTTCPTTDKIFSVGMHTND